MKKWKYFLTASILACALFASTPASIFADGTAADPAGSGTVSTEQTEEDQTGEADGTAADPAGSGTVSTEQTEENQAGENDQEAENQENPEDSGEVQVQSSDSVDSSSDPSVTMEAGNDAYAVKTVEDGTYVIAMASDGFKVIDASASDGAVKLGDADGSSAQQFRVAWDENGKYYTIQSADGAYLAAADSNQALNSGVVRSSDAGAWYLVPDGTLYHRSETERTGRGDRFRRADGGCGSLPR